MDVGLSFAGRRSLALDRALAWRLALGAVFTASVVLRSLAAWRRVAPDYFPDEDTYAALSRSIAAGHLPAVRGHTVLFPALLEPVLTAPAWWFGSLETGYRITQELGVLAMSSAAFVCFWGARRLGAERGPALAAAALAVAIPDLGYSAFVLSEPFAYPLFLAAIVTGAAALARPTRRSQAVFVVLALAAAFARLQLAVLIPAYLVTALLLGRLRHQRVAFAGLGAAVLVVVAAVVGFYGGGKIDEFSPAALGRNVLVLAFAAGWIAVPAGLLGIAGSWFRPRSDLERAFGAFATVAAVGVLLEATLYGAVSSVHERYGFYVLPLLFLGFALHASRGWPWRPAAAAISALLLLAAATVTMSGWSPAHSLFLIGLHRLDELAGSPGGGGVVLALAAGALSLVGALCAWRRLTVVAAVLSLAFCCAASALAVSFDSRNSANTRASFLPAGPDWIQGPATVVLGPASEDSFFQQLFWDRGATAAAVLPGVVLPDTFGATATAISPDGRLRGLSGRVVLDEDGDALVPAQPLHWNAAWLEAASPQLVAAIDGRGGDTWIAPSGEGRIYRQGRLSFTVTAPAKVTFTLAGKRIVLAANTPTRVSVCGARTFRYRFSTHGWVGLRQVSARTSFPRFTPGSC